MTITISGTYGLQNMPSTAAPAFSASRGSLSVTLGVNTKITFTTGDFDTASAFNLTAFNPKVAGYYQVNLNVQCSGDAASSSGSCSIFKNGTSYTTVYAWNQNGYGCRNNLSALIYMNGSTDYIEAYGQNGAGTSLPISLFSASLVRAA